MVVAAVGPSTSPFPDHAAAATAAEDVTNSRRETPVSFFSLIPGSLVIWLRAVGASLIRHTGRTASWYRHRTVRWLFARRAELQRKYPRTRFGRSWGRGRHRYQRTFLSGGSRSTDRSWQRRKVHPT